MSSLKIQQYDWQRYVIQFNMHWNAPHVGVPCPWEFPCKNAPNDVDVQPIQTQSVNCIEDYDRLGVVMSDP